MNSKSSRTPSDIQESIVTETVKKNPAEPVYRKYLKGRFLGKGGFARVYEFLDLETKALFAGKVIEKSTLVKPRTKQKLMSEIKIHRSLKHSNIVKFDHFFEDSDNVYILLELCQNQTLTELIRRRKRLTEIEVQCYIIQVVSALKYLHRHMIIHRDIKLGNLLLSEKMEIKMGDFGLASKLEYEGERKRTICGTPNYIAPEILDGKTGHSFEVDVWSLGVLTYTLLVGKPPFETADIKSTYRKIKTNSYSFPETLSLSEDSISFIKSILVTDPVSRLTLDEMMSHSFLTKSPIPKLMPASTLAVPPHTLTHSNSQGLRSRSKTDLLSIPIARTLSNADNLPFTVRDTQNIQKKSKPEKSEGKKPFLSSYNPENSENLWVKKWVDYSSKYGIGYLLSNSTVGVYFNDSTKIIHAGDSFDYYSRSSEPSSFTFEEYPENLKKKVTLLEHFRKHLMTDDKGSEAKRPLVFVKKWLVTSHATFFRLSNRVVQVVFLDKSEVLLCSDKKIVIFVDKSGYVSEHNLSTAMESNNKDLIKRLKYSKEVLNNMLQPVNV